jgi:DUF4097 and DUF4098 domain-containing protein YvlB
MNTLQKVILGLASAALITTAQAEDLDITHAVAADATVTVINVAGEIGVSTWDREEVRLTGHTGANAELHVTENSQGIQFEVRQLRNRSRSDESVLELVVPAGASIVAEGVSADITIEGSRGAQIRAESVSGDVTVRAEVGRVDLSTVSGDIEFSGSASRSSAETVSGDIELRGISGEATIKSVSGDALAETGTLTIGKLESVSGSLELITEVEAGGRLTIENMSGDVSLALPDAQSGEFRAQSFSGGIRTQFGRVERAEHGPGSYLKHIEGDSGTLIRVESFSGDVHINRR